MYKLIIEDDEGKTTVVPLIRSQITIGRGEGNAIRLNERNISRRHARLWIEDGHIHIEDLNSYNGIFTNGEMIQQNMRLKPGDLVEIGDYHLSIRDADEASEPEARPSSPPSDGASHTPDIPLPAVGSTEGLTRKDIRLVVISTSLAGKRFSMNKDEITIGRTEDNDIPLDHVSVSRGHAKLTYANGTFQIYDLDSANGVRVNGESYTTCDLRLGDILELGHVRLRFATANESAQIELNFQDDPEEVMAATVAAAQAQQNSRWMVLAGAVTGMLLVCVVAIVFLLQKGRLASFLGNPPPKRSLTDTQEPRPPATAPSKEDLATLLKRAQEAYDVQNYEESQRLVEEVLQKQAGLKEAEELRDKVFFEKKQRNLLRKVDELQNEEKFYEALQKLNQVSKESRYAKKVAEERPLLTRAAINALMQKTKEAMANQRFNEALQFCEAVLQLDPDFAEAQAHHKTLQQRLQIKPETPQRPSKKEPKRVAPSTRVTPPPPRRIRLTKAQRCELLKKKGRFEKALACYKQLIQEPNEATAEAYLAMGTLSEKAGRCARQADPEFNYLLCLDAVRHYKIFLQKDPKHAEAPRIRKHLSDIQRLSGTKKP